MKHWTPSEETELRKIYKTMTARQLAERFGTTAMAIHQKYWKLGLRKGYDHARIRLGDSERRWLRLNFPHMRNEICATYLGVSLRTVNRLAADMNLRKTAQFMKESQAYTSRKAKESHLRNGTYPAKGYYSPNLRKGEAYQFKPKTSPQ